MRDEATILTPERFRKAIELMEAQARKPRDPWLYVSAALYDLHVTNSWHIPPYWVRLSSDRMPRP